MFTLHLTLHASLKNNVFALYLTDILLYFFPLLCVIFHYLFVDLFVFHSIHFNVFIS